MTTDITALQQLPETESTAAEVDAPNACFTTPISITVC